MLRRRSSCAAHTTCLFQGILSTEPSCQSLRDKRKSIVNCWCHKNHASFAEVLPQKTERTHANCVSWRRSERGANAGLSKAQCVRRVAVRSLRRSSARPARLPSPSPSLARHIQRALQECKHQKSRNACPVKSRLQQEECLVQREGLLQPRLGIRSICDNFVLCPSSHGKAWHGNF